MATVDAHGYDSMQTLIVSMSQQRAQVLRMRVMIYVYQLRGLVFHIGVGVLGCSF